MTDFKSFICNLLSTLNVSKDAFKKLTTPEAIRVYEIAFTQIEQLEAPETEHIESPADGTYQTYEQIGDSIIKVFMVSYFYRRFPKLWKNSCGVKIVARLIIKYGSKEVLSSLSTYYGFEPYIKTNSESFSKQRRLSLLEDVFEAFIGATSIIIDASFGAWGMGNIVAYNLLETIFNRLDIPLDYENLFDAKTRLKELVDMYKEKMGEIDYITTKEGSRVCVRIEWRFEEKRRIIAEGVDCLKNKAEQLAASIALKELNAAGFEKKVQREYLEII